MKEQLDAFGFVFLEGGKVQLGSSSPLPCRLEGFRRNEVPVREVFVSSFWISKFCVTNHEYEEYDRKHRRPITSRDDKHPVTEVTYMNAISYAQWLSEKTNIVFSLPTEAQWIFSAAPFGWEYPWGMIDDRSRGHFFNPDPDKEGPLLVDDSFFGTNWCGLYHIGGNIQEFISGCHYIFPGSDGAETDGMYCLTKGGDWSHCPRSASVHRRGIIDVAGRAPTLGFRLVVNI